eukprot:5496990-Pleurochrysis_carterae.AAC.1
MTFCEDREKRRCSMPGRGHQAQLHAFCEVYYLPPAPMYLKSTRVAALSLGGHQQQYDHCACSAQRWSGLLRQPNQGYGQD